MVHVCSPEVYFDGHGKFRALAASRFALRRSAVLTAIKLNVYSARSTEKRQMIAHNAIKSHFLYPFIICHVRYHKWQTAMHAGQAIALTNECSHVWTFEEYWIVEFVFS